MKDSELTFWEHLDELRSTLWRVVVVLVLSVIVSFFFKEELFSIILAPKEPDFYIYRFFNFIGEKINIEGLGMDNFNLKLINTKLSGQFIMHMTVSLYAGLILSSPYILYKLFSFISPALYQKEKKYAVSVLFWGYVLFAIGVALSYFVIFPFTFRFFALYSVSMEVENTILLSSYIDTLVVLSVLMGVVFEIPILAWLLSKFGLINASLMRKFRRHSIVVALIISAIITPTSDVVTLLLVSLPIIMLYEVSIFVVGLTDTTSNT